MPGQIGRVAYGVLFNGDDAGNADYMTGVEVADFSNVPAAFTRLRVAAQRYAVFTHRQHISEIRRTWYTIWNKWLPESGRGTSIATWSVLFTFCSMESRRDQHFNRTGTVSKLDNCLRVLDCREYQLHCPENLQVSGMG